MPHRCAPAAAPPRAAVLCAAAGAASALDNGLAVTPPMGFRTWNQFGLNVNQTMMEEVYAVMAGRSRSVDGKKASLLDVGYDHAGIDDGWQLCNSGPGGKGYHNSTGYPLMDKSRFPDPVAMTQRARSLGLSPGWYAANCHCSDHKCTGPECYKGDVQATLDFGFNSIKVDSCGATTNVSEYAELFNASGEAVLLENCHNGKASKGHCPMNLFRTSGDIRPTYGSILGNLLTVNQFNSEELTGPGCWAYPDMLEVGVTAPQPPGAKHHCQTASTPCEMNVTEWRTHFGAWCIVSAPLILGMDLRDTAQLDAVWDIITNTEAIAVNQQWSGDSGRIHAQSDDSATLPNCGSGSSCKHPAWLVLTKALPPTAAGLPRAALLLMNNGGSAVTLSADLASVHGFAGCGGAACAVRDVWARADRPGAAAVSAELAPHDSALLVVTAASAPAPTPAPAPQPSCLEEGVQYDSHKPGNTNLEKSARSAATGAACQSVCAGVPGCVCFTLNLDNGNCWLMTNCTTPTQRKASVSGPAHC